MQDIVMNVENFIWYEEPVHMFDYSFNSEYQIVGAILLNGTEYFISEMVVGEKNLHTLHWVTNFIPPKHYGLNTDMLKMLGVIV